MVDSEPVYDAEPVHDAEIIEPRQAGRDAYNIVSDTVTGINVRPRDNLIQALAIAVSLLLGVAIGALVISRDRILGAVGGGFVGLLAGLFGSGLFLMIYRFVRHTQGRHD